MICGVRNCGFQAEGWLDDFAVCGLHDSPKTRAILEHGERPGSFWYCDRPVVLPCGDLTEEDFDFRTADGPLAEDDPAVIRAAHLPTNRFVHPACDLLREEE